MHAMECELGAISLLGVLIYNTVNYRYNVSDGTLKKLRYIRFYVIPV